MADTGFISAEAAERASKEPMQVVGAGARIGSAVFVDYLTQEMEERTKASGPVDVYSTLDLHLQRVAQDAVRDGIAQVEKLLSKRRPRVPQAALIAVDPGRAKSSR
jgi:membrane peptidoglycan carboxypeptidase